jgi:hypothetical protein
LENDAPQTNNEFIIKISMRIPQPNKLYIDQTNKPEEVIYQTVRSKIEEQPPEFVNCKLEGEEAYGFLLSKVKARLEDEQKEM